MSKAFDSLHFPLLIAKLREYGFSDEALGFMGSYFCERKCRLRIDLETTSEWYETILKGYPLRAVYCKKSAPYEELLRWADLHTLRNRRLQEMATVMYKVKNNLSP